MTYMEKWPPVAEIREARREQLLKARGRRNLLIAERLANPRVRKAVTKEVTYDSQSGFARAAARFYRLAVEQAQRKGACR